MTNAVLRLGATLGAFVLAITALLSGTNSLTHDKIEENAQAAANAARAALIEAERFEPVSEDIFSAVKNGEIVGYCVNVAPSGYGGEIKMIVAFDPGGEVSGSEIISMSETPGLGANVKEKGFRAQFGGKKPPLKIGSGGVEALSGATVSSAAVVSGINAAHEMLEEGGFIK